MRVAVDLGRRGDQDAGLVAFCVQQCVVGAIERGQQSADSVSLVEDGRSRTSEVIDLVASDVEWPGDISLDQFYSQTCQIAF